MAVKKKPVRSTAPKAAAKAPTPSVLDELGGDTKVKVAVTDIDGILRGKYLHKDKFLSAATGGGFGFCNVIFGWDSSDVCYDNASYTGWHSGYPDAHARIDLSTFRRVPWDENVPFFLGEFVDDQSAPLSVCPRQLLRKVLADAKAAGYEVKAGFEFEWFNFQESAESLAEKSFQNPVPLTPGMFGYSVLRMTQNAPFFRALFDDLLAFGVPIEGLHTETGPGVTEAAILYSDALTAADRAILFKTSAKEVGSRFGILPSFMAKWNKRLPGCSGHIHVSLWKNGENAFYDARDPHKMSPVMKQFIEGSIRALPEVLPFFAPTVNSYKRLVDGYWAPTKPTWGIDNRTVAFRVIPGSAKSTRLEIRVGGADENPYLALAAAIAGGIAGIADRAKLTSAPVVGSAYTNSDAPRLPRNLALATAALDRSKLARKLFGAPFVEHFVQTRDWEWRQFQEAVTSWELERYFEII